MRNLWISYKNKIQYLRASVLIAPLWNWNKLQTVELSTEEVSSNWTIMELKSKRDIGVRGHSVLIVPTRNWNVMKTRPWEAWPPMALWMGCRARARQGWAKRTSHGCTSAGHDTDHVNGDAKYWNHKKTFQLSAWRDGATPLIIMHWFAGCYKNACGLLAKNSLWIHT